MVCVKKAKNMTRKTWVPMVLIVVSLAAFFGYRAVDKMLTDTVAPVITLEEQVPEISVKDSSTGLLQGVSATDKEDGDVTKSLVVEGVSLLDSTGRLLVSYAAFDSSGNVTKAQREAKYTDYESPRFTLSEPLIYPLNSGFDVLSAVGAIDVIDGDIQHRVRATSLENHSIARSGTSKVEFRVTNSLGDTVSLTLPVEVYDPASYDAGLSLTEYLVYLPKGASFDADSYLNTFTLRGEEIILRSGLPEDFSLKTKGVVFTHREGIYSVEFRVTYIERHATNPELDREYTGYSKLIVVVEG